jgi:hypothetical protein
MGAANQIVLDLPIPPSVNRTRRVDWQGHKQVKEFYTRSDLFLSAHDRDAPRKTRIITGPYQLTIAIPETLSGIDLDNHCKTLIDYLVSREFVAGDDKQHLRRLVVEWAFETVACRITITDLSTPA